jgi:hypothetical protein
MNYLEILHRFKSGDISIADAEGLLKSLSASPKQERDRSKKKKRLRCLLKKMVDPAYFQHTKGTLKL